MKKSASGGALRVLGWGGSESGALKPQQKNIATKNYLGSDKKDSEHFKNYKVLNLYKMVLVSIEGM